MYQIEHKTCDILAAERLRFMRFDNRLIIDSFQNAVNILQLWFSVNFASWYWQKKKVTCCSTARKRKPSILWHKHKYKIFLQILICLDKLFQLLAILWKSRVKRSEYDKLRVRLIGEWWLSWQRFFALLDFGVKSFVCWVRKQLFDSASTKST